MNKIPHFNAAIERAKANLQSVKEAADTYKKAERFAENSRDGKSRMLLSLRGGHAHEEGNSSLSSVLLNEEEMREVRLIIECAIKRVQDAAEMKIKQGGHHEQGD